MPVDVYGALAIIIVLELVLIELFLFGQNTFILRNYKTLPYSAFLAHFSAANLLGSVVALVTFFVILLLPSELIEDKLPMVSKCNLLSLTIVIWFQGLVLLFQAYLRITEDTVSFGIVRVFSQCSRLILILCLVLFEPSLNSYLLGGLLSALAGLSLAIIINFWRQERLRPVSNSIKFPVWSVNLNFGLPLSIHGIIGAAYSGVDRLIISSILEAKDVGAYHFAAFQGAAPFFVIYVLGLVFMPKFYADKTYSEQARKYLNLFLIMSIIMSSFLGIIMYYVVYPTTLLFVDNAYSAGHDIIIIFCVILIFQCFSNRGVYLLTILKQLRVIPAITIICLFINVTLSIKLIPIFGIIGAAYAVLIGEMVNACLINIMCLIYYTEVKRPA